MKKIILALIAGVVLISCEKEEGYNNYSSRLGTFEETGEGSKDYHIILDNGTTLVPFENSTSKGNFSPNERVIAFYSKVSEDSDGELINAAIHSIDDVLTKDVVTLTGENQDSIGNNTIHIHEEDIWISNNYLNFYFSYLGYNKTHYVNLIKYPNDSINDEDRLILEFRHNNNDDFQNYEYTGIVSFDLNSLPQTSSDSVTFVVKIQDYFAGEVYWNGTYYPALEQASFREISQEDFVYLID